MKKVKKTSKSSKQNESQVDFRYVRLAIAITILIITGFATASLLQPSTSESISAEKENIPNKVTIPDQQIPTTPDPLIPATPDKNNANNTSTCKPGANKLRPYRISIPAANITNACIEHTYVGEKAPGQLDDPKNKWNFGWYRASSVPSKDGAGVYTCHDGNGNLANIIPAICNSLNKLKVGDKITVEAASGTTYVYKVVRAVSTPVGQVNMEEFQQVYGGAKRGLSIMACDGRYNANSKRTHRFLVYAQQI